MRKHLKAVGYALLVALGLGTGCAAPLANPEHTNPEHTHIGDCASCVGLVQVHDQAQTQQIYAAVQKAFVAERAQNVAARKSLLVTVRASASDASSLPPVPDGPIPEDPK